MLLYSIDEAIWWVESREETVDRCVCVAKPAQSVHFLGSWRQDPSTPRRPPCHGKEQENGGSRICRKEPFPLQPPTHPPFRFSVLSTMANSRTDPLTYSPSTTTIASSSSPLFLQRKQPTRRLAATWWSLHQVIRYPFSLCRGWLLPISLPSLNQVRKHCSSPSNLAWTRSSRIDFSSSTHLANSQSFLTLLIRLFGRPFTLHALHAFFGVFLPSILTR